MRSVQRSAQLVGRDDSDVARPTLAGKMGDQLPETATETRFLAYRREYGGVLDLERFVPCR